MRFLATVVLIVTLGLVAIPSSTALSDGPFQMADQQTAQAASPESYGYYCQCVDYVRQRFGLFPSGGWFVGAQDMGPYLMANGLVPISWPQPGAIAVFPSWYGAGIHPWYGHVAVVQNAYWYGDSAQLVLRGANQSYSGIWSEYGCYNVSDLYHIHHSPSYPYIDYYVWPGISWMLQPLTVSNANPQVGEKISVTFAFQNVGGLNLNIETVMAGGRKGTTWDAPVSADFSAATDITLAPGEVYYYYGTFTTQEPGDYFVAPMVKINGAWSEIADANYAWYTVQPAEAGTDVTTADAGATATPEATSAPAEEAATEMPATAVPPTATAVPPTELPVAAEDPTAEPVAEVKPTSEPPASEAPTDAAPPTTEPTPEPTAEVPAVDANPSTELPTSSE